MPFDPDVVQEDGSIPLCGPEIRGNELKYVKECLDTAWVSSVGPFVDRFEKLVAERVGAKYAVAVVNGTAALHIALIVAGVEPDDEVHVSALSFIAPANAVRYVGAWPVFVDAEPNYWQMDPQKVVDFLERRCEWAGGELRNKMTGRRVKAVIPVHILGHPCDMDPILEVARKYNLVVIEDATESLGARYKGYMVGNLGDIACFSFNGNKIITTGGGGMIVTNNERSADYARYLTTQAKDDAVEYVHKQIGYNYRLTNIQAALGCAQMEKLEEYIVAKRRIASTYSASLAKMPGLSAMREAQWAFSTFWMYTLLVDEKEYGMDSRALLHKLKEANVEVRPLWQPLHLSPAHKGVHGDPCPVAEGLNRRALRLPCSVGLTATDQARIVAAILDARHGSIAADGRSRMERET